MELRVIQTLDDFVSLRHRWPVPDNTIAGSGIFLSYEWFYCCLCSFRKDKILNRNISPGYLLSSEIVKKLFQKGCSEFHLGPGAHEYKFDWADRVHEQDTISISNNTCAGIAVWFIKAWIKPVAKLIRDRLRRSQNKRA